MKTKSLFLEKWKLQDYEQKKFYKNVQEKVSKYSTYLVNIYDFICDQQAKCFTFSFCSASPKNSWFSFGKQLP